MIVTVKREKEINGALPGKVFVNGSFFGYSLENAAYKIPVGNYRAALQDSAKFGKKLLFLDVLGRSGILVHNGNTKDDTRGCIIAARERSSKDTVKNGLAEDLAELAKNQSDISVRVVNDNGKIWLVAMSGLLAAFLIFGQTKGD